LPVPPTSRNQMSCSSRHSIFLEAAPKSATSASLPSADAQAFIVERSSLRRILKNLDYDCQPPEPLAHSPPEAELLYAPA
jgi:hypothetical protein